MKDFADIDNAVGSFPSVTATDASGPGETDSFALVADYFNQHLGWIQALLNNVGVEPSGSDEVYNSSQIVDAILANNASWFKNILNNNVSGGYDLADLATDGSIVFAFGDDGSDARGYYSHDGMAWSPKLVVSSKYGTGVAYGNSYWVATVNGGNIYHATDPTGTWTFNDISVSNLNDVAYGNGYFVAVGASGALYYATDPTGSWTSNTQGSEDLNDIYYDSDDDLWVIVGENGTIYTRDTDPTGSFTLNDQGSQDFNAVIKGTVDGSSLWVVVGDSDIIYTATDPTGSWTSRTSDSTSGSDILGITFGNGIFMASCTHASSVQGKGVQYSRDGVTWEAVPISYKSGPSIYFKNSMLFVGQSGVLLHTLKHG